MLGIGVSRDQIYLDAFIISFLYGLIIQNCNTLVLNECYYFYILSIGYAFCLSFLSYFFPILAILQINWR